MEDYRLEQTGQEVQRILNGAAMDANLQAEVERATEAEGRLQGNIDAEAQARQDADGLLQQGIDDEAQRAKDAEEANAGEIEGIKALIPATASDTNKLADTNYVNSSIQTATAEYRGDYNVVTDLHLAIDATHAQIETLLPTVIAEADKNDYCYVMIPTSAQTPTEIAKIERYKMTSEGWKFEYDVNNSTFTADEWAAIKSGITSGLVSKLNALPTNADLLLLLAGKQDVLTFDSVPVPESNNPVKSGGVYSAIDDEKTARLNSDTAIHAELDGLQAKVPATASSDNKLVDQNQMNSSISTATATFRGDWNVVSDLHLAVDATRAQIAALLPTVISTADNNDYCYVEIPTSAETPTQIERVERYKFNGTAWAYEYTLNNSGFTAAQWAAINSMITSGLVAKLSALPTNADLLAMLAQKQDNLTFDSTPTENSTNPVTSGGVFAADKALSDTIEAILLLIPSAASSLNKLVDTALMNSSISTATATFRGTYNLVSDLGLGIDATEGQIAAALSTAISTADNNDYAFIQIPTSAQTPTQIARTDRYKFNGTAWAFEYTLNTSGFTAAQWAAINSTITSALVAKLNALPTAAELQEALGVLTSGITAINQKIPSTASQSNKLVDNASMESYITQVINILDASFNVTSTDGHITLHITQMDGIITSVQVQSTDIASAADLALKASQADLTALASRVTTAEGNITSLTGRMGTAETNIANLQQLYNNLQQSKPVPVTALPSTGQQQGVIYRLAGTTSYSDYMWNGSRWVLMSTYNNAIDDVPIPASANLVKSGGVASIAYSKEKMGNVGRAQGWLKEDGSIQSSTNYFYYYDVRGLEKVNFKSIGVSYISTTYSLYWIIDINGTILAHFTGYYQSEFDIVVDIPQNAYWFIAVTEYYEVYKYKPVNSKIADFEDKVLVQTTLQRKGIGTGWLKNDGTIATSPGGGTYSIYECIENIDKYYVTAVFTFSPGYGWAAAWIADAAGNMLACVSGESWTLNMLDCMIDVSAYPDAKYIYLTYTPSEPTVKCMTLKRDAISNINQWYSKKVVYMGSSIPFGQTVSPDVVVRPYPQIMAENLGMNLILTARPGMAIETNADGTAKTYGSLSLSIAELEAQEKATTPYQSYQNAMLGFNADLYVFDCEPNNDNPGTELLALFDFVNWRYTDNSTFAEHRDSYIGAMLFLIDQLWTENPAAKIVFVTEFGNLSYINTPYSIREATITLAEKLRVKVINLWEKLYYNYQNISIYLNSDMVHPKNAAHIRIGAIMTNEILLID